MALKNFVATPSKTWQLGHQSQLGENYCFNKLLQIVLNWFASSNLPQQKFVKWAVQTSRTTHANMKGIYIDNSLLHTKENLGIFVQMPEYADDQVSMCLCVQKCCSKKLLICACDRLYIKQLQKQTKHSCVLQAHNCTLPKQLYRCVCLIQDVTHLLQGILFPRIQKKGQR